MANDKKNEENKKNEERKRDREQGSLFGGYGDQPETDPMTGEKVEEEGEGADLFSSNRPDPRLSTEEAVSGERSPGTRTPDRVKAAEGHRAEGIRERKEELRIEAERINAVQDPNDPRGRFLSQSNAPNVGDRPIAEGVLGSNQPPTQEPQAVLHALPGNSGNERDERHARRRVHPNTEAEMEAGRKHVESRRRAPLAPEPKQEEDREQREERERLEDKERADREARERKGLAGKDGKK